MNFLKSLDISASGLHAQRKRMDVISNNLANLETTRTKEGGPYRRKMVVMSKGGGPEFSRLLESEAEGVKVDEIIEDNTPFKKIYNPSHPDSNPDGYLLKPNIDLIVEITNMLMAKRAFEANATAIKTTKQMAIKALEIGR